MLRDVLDAVGYRAVTASDGAAGLDAEQFTSRPFDLDDLLGVVKRCLHPPAL